jgi:acyl-CoA synthetase (AMP-forming)/AMP-acid ligase II
MDFLTVALSGCLIVGTACVLVKDYIRLRKEREINRLKLEAKIQSMRNAKKRKVKAIKRAKAQKLEAEKRKAETLDITPIINHVLKPQEK